MNCMKCSRETSGEQVFCEECLTVMQAHPVPPDTVVQIPRRPARAPEKKHREVSAKEQIAQLHSTIRWLMLTVVVLSVVLMLTAAMLLNQLDKTSSSIINPLGRNYTTNTTQEQP